MEEENQKEIEKTKVGFPAASEPQKSGNGKVIVLIVIILLILGGATWYLLSRKEETIEFTNESITPVETRETPTPVATKSESKSGLSIQIQNGTGTPGDAGKLEKALNDLGYSETSTGNAGSYDYDDAVVVFSADFPETYKSEILKSLSQMYASVQEGGVTLGDFDAVVITGKAKSTKATTATPTAKITQTAKPSPSITLSPTP